jgi:hypothetical protein
LDRRQLQALFALDFLTRKEHALFVGPVGIGKTILARGAAAMRAGRTVLFSRADSHFKDLAQARIDHPFEKAFRRYRALELLVVGDFGPITRRYVGQDESSSRLNRIIAATVSGTNATSVNPVYAMSRLDSRPILRSQDRVLRCLSKTGEVEDMLLSQIPKPMWSALALALLWFSLGPALLDATVDILLGLLGPRSSEQIGGLNDSQEIPENRYELLTNR